MIHELIYSVCLRGDRVICCYGDTGSRSQLARASRLCQCVSLWCRSQGRRCESLICDLQSATLDATNILPYSQVFHVRKREIKDATEKTIYGRFSMIHKSLITLF